MSCAWQKVGRSGQDDRIGRGCIGILIWRPQPHGTADAYPQINQGLCIQLVLFSLLPCRGKEDGHWIEDNTEKERKTGCSSIYPAPERERERERETEDRVTLGRLGLSPPVPSSRHNKLHAAKFTNVSICTAAHTHGWCWPSERRRDGRSRCLPFSPFPQTARCDSGWGRLLNQTDYTCCSAWRRLPTLSSSLAPYGRVCK